MSVYGTVKDKRIADVALTGEWENALTQIEYGKMPPAAFRKAIDDYTRQITAELLDVPVFPSFGGGQGEALCPKCKTANVSFFPKVVKCSDVNCGLIIFRTKSEKQLSDGQISELLTNGKTPVIKGFKTKNGKPFDAALKFDDNFMVIFDFVEKKGKK